MTDPEVASTQGPEAPKAQKSSKAAGLMSKIKEKGPGIALNATVATGKYAILAADKMASASAVLIVKFPFLDRHKNILLIMSVWFSALELKTLFFDVGIANYLPTFLFKTLPICIIIAAHFAKKYFEKKSI